MEEVAQVALALKHLSWGKQVALLTDARFSGEAPEPASDMSLLKLWQMDRSEELRMKI